MRRACFSLLVRLVMLTAALTWAGCDGGAASPDPMPTPTPDVDDADEADATGVDVHDGTDADEDTAPGDTTDPPDTPGDGGDATSDDATTDDAALEDAARDDAGRDAGATPESAAQLDAFFEAHGGRDAFPPSYVDVVTAMITVEDLVAAGDIAAAREALDRVFATYPLSDPVWWTGYGIHGTNVGTPVAYYALRMLDEIVTVAIAHPTPPTTSLTLGVVMARCGEGQRPTDPEGSAPGETVSLTIDPALADDDHAALRQSLRVFQWYVEAITDRRVGLDVAFETVDTCVDLSFEGSWSGTRNPAAVVEAASDDLRAVADLWMVLYPSNVPPGDAFAGVEYITGGMGAVGPGQAMFIADDQWILRKPPHLGDGAYTDIERRVYLPQWYQHEFFHHLYRIYPEFGLEAASHQWFDRSTWPDDFEGAWEPDYYAESLAKRLRGAEPPLHVALSTSPPSADDLTAVTVDDLVGRWERAPVENDWHRVTTEVDGDGLWWRNDAGVRWSLTFTDGRLRAGDDCPYGAQDLTIELGRDDDGAYTTDVVALWFGGERYGAR